MKKTILISPYSRKLRNGKENPKNYPYWAEIVNSLKEEFNIVQIGIKSEEVVRGIENILIDLPLDKLKETTLSVDLWLSVDNFFPHFCHTFNSHGIVIFSQSDPLIFGYEENLNIFKDRKYLRRFQFDIWEAAEYNLDVYVSPEFVIENILNKINQN